MISAMRVPPDEYQHSRLRAHEPLRFILYPAMLRRIQRAWIAAFGAAI
jgi:hypothetical protein